MFIPQKGARVPRTAEFQRGPLWSLMAFAKQEDRYSTAHDWLVVTGTMEFYIGWLIINIWLIYGNTWSILWNFMTFHSVGNVIIPTVTHSIIFQRGRRKTTKQIIINHILTIY